MSASTSKVITFRADDVAALDEHAKAAGVTRSEYLRQLVAGLGRSGGAWVAYYPDMSGVYPFATELEARRHAAGSSMDVKFVPYGMSV